MSTRLRHRAPSLKTPDHPRLPRKRRLRPLRKQAEAVTAAGELAKFGARGAQEISEVAQTIGRSPRTKKILRVTAYGICGFWLALAALLVAGQFLLDEKFVLMQLTSFIEKQSGGKFSYEEGSFSLLQGLLIKDAALYPPRNGDKRGYVNGGEVASAPLVVIKELRLDLRLYKIVYGRLDFGDLKLVEPAVEVDQDASGLVSVNAINAYRAANLPVSPPSPVSTEALNVRELFPVAPSKVFLPLSTYLSFGIERLSMRVNDKTTGKQTKMSGLDTHIRFSWMGRSSQLDINVSGAPLEVSTASLKLSDKLSLNISLKDFTQLTVGMHQAELSLSQGKLTVDELGMDLASVFIFSPNYDAVEIKTFKFTALDALIYQLTGDLALPHGTPDLVRMKLKHQFALDMFSLSDVLQKIVPDLNINGHIASEALTMQGDLEPQQLSTADLKVPFVNGSIKFQDLRADSQSLGFQVRPINGNIALGAGPALNGSGSQLDLSSDFDFSGASLTANTSAGKQDVDMGALSARLVSRLRFPKVELPFFRLNMHADHIQARANDVLVADVPFDLDLIGDFREALAKASATMRVELPQLAEVSTSLVCDNGCSSTRLESSVNLRSITKVMALLRPTLQKFLSLKDIPEEARGSVDFRLSARGENLSFDNIALSSKQNISIDAQVNIQDFGLTLPLRGLILKGFNHRMTVAANSMEQAISLTQSLSELTFTPSRGDPLGPALLQAYELRADVKNSSATGGDENLLDAIKKGESSANFTFTLGTAGAANYLPRNLKDLSASGVIKREAYRFINVEKLVLALPDFGFSSNMSLQSFLDQKFMPYGVKASLRAGIEHSEEKLLLSGVKTKGRAMVDIGLSSVSQDLVRLDGAVDFLNFFINVPKQDKPSEALLSVEGMNGYVPLQQLVSKAQWLTKGQATVQTQDGTDLKTAIEAFFARSDNALFELQNKTAEVDYPELRPFYRDRRPISIEKVEAANLEARNIEVDVELKQNWLSINQFALDFLGGKIQGDTHIAFDTAPLALKTSVHLTRLDSRKLVEGIPKLRKKSKSYSLLSDPYIDASVHLNFNLRANDLGGAVEVTSIGKEQLRMMLFYLDPNQDDQTMGQLRSALNFGEVKQVSVPIKNGFVGIDVDLRLLATPIPTPQIRGFPIAQLLANYKAQAGVNAALETPSEKEDAHVEGH